MEYKLHNPATKRSVNPYTDNYTGFIWNGHHSSDFNCFIENTGHLTFEPAPDFSNSTVSPAFYDGALYTGTQTQSKKMQLNLVFYHVTLEDFNRALNWLDRKVVSSFLLDYDPNWRYQCKLASLGTVEKYVDGYCINQQHGSATKRDLYICRMQASFETVDIHNALATYATALLPTDKGPISPEELDQVVHTELLSIYTDGNDTQLTSGKSTSYDTVIDWRPHQYIVFYNYDNDALDKLSFLDYRETITFENVEYEVWQERITGNGRPEDDNYRLLPVNKLYKQYNQMTPRYYFIDNTHAAPITFRMHLCNFTSDRFIIYQYIPNLMDGTIEQRPICTVDLNLDLVQRMTLHYDSRTGSLTVGNQLASAIMDGNGNPLVKYYNTVANFSVPAYEKAQIVCSDNFDGDIILEYDLQQSVI